MNFFTRLAVAALALALAALAPARATTYTTQYSVTNGAYVSLGAGTMFGVAGTSGATSRGGSGSTQLTGGSPGL